MALVPCASLEFLGSGFDSMWLLIVPACSSLWKRVLFVGLCVPYVSESQARSALLCGICCLALACPELLKCQ